MCEEGWSVMSVFNANTVTPNEHQRNNERKYHRTYGTYVQCEEVGPLGTKNSHLGGGTPLYKRSMRN